MCFYIHPKHKEKKIAKRDIVCYKFGRITKTGKFSPHWYSGFHYTFGEKVEQNPTKKWPTIDTDFCGGKAIYRGFHSYSNKKELPGHEDGIIGVKCIIPKGTEYYYNPECRTYVSRALIVQEEIQI